MRRRPPPHAPLRARPRSAVVGSRSHRACAGAASPTARRAAGSRRPAAGRPGATSATFDASTARLNIDSPAKNPPIAMPYRPPTSSPSSLHVSTLCTQPSSCMRSYAATIGSVIHPPFRRGSPHARSPPRTSCRHGPHIGASNGAATATSAARREEARRGDRATTTPSGRRVQLASETGRCGTRRARCRARGRRPRRQGRPHRRRRWAESAMRSAEARPAVRPSTLVRYLR